MDCKVKTKNVSVMRGQSNREKRDDGIMHSLGQKQPVDGAMENESEAPSTIGLFKQIGLCAHGYPPTPQRYCHTTAVF
jgi:hypothetical protein